jgi:drug/metabolite transporter (DMT)-like permease
VAASLMYQTALHSSPLSLCVPFLAFTPVFLLGLAWIFLKEVPTPLGILGVVLVTAGAFFIQSDGKNSPLQIFKNLFQQKGPILMLGVAFIYSLTSVLAKRALIASSPFYFSGVYYFLIVLGLLPVQWKRPNWKQELISKPKWFAAIGVCEALSFLLQFHAFLFAKTAYVIAVKRLSLLFAVLYGAIFFNEEKILRRTVGALLMIGGAGLIAVA